MQSELDVKRYEYVASLSPEEQANFKTMENCVEKLIGTGCPFFFLMAPEKEDKKFWRYQSMTREKLPLSEEEAKAVSRRSWYAMQTHAKHFAMLTGHTVQFMTKSGVPFYQVRPDGDIAFEGEPLK